MESVYPSLTIIGILVSFPLFSPKAVMYSNCLRNYKYIFEKCILMGGRMDGVVQRVLDQINLSKGIVSPNCKSLDFPLYLEC